MGNRVVLHGALEPVNDIDDFVPVAL